MVAPKGGSDFLINIDSNVSLVMGQIEQAIKKASRLEASLVRAQNKAIGAEAKMGGGTRGGGVSRVTSPELVSALNSLNGNIQMFVPKA